MLTFLGHVSIACTLQCFSSGAENQTKAKQSNCLINNAKKHEQKSSKTPKLS